MDFNSQKIINEFPTVSVETAQWILFHHGFEDADVGFDGDLGHAFDPAGYECILKLKNDRVDTEELFDWLGY